MAGGKGGQQSESSQAIELGRSKNSARKIAAVNDRDPNEETSLELDELQASLESGNNSGPSLEATPNGRRGLKLNLKFKVPSSKSTQPSSSTQENQDLPNQNQMSDIDTSPDNSRQSSSSAQEAPQNSFDQSQNEMTNSSAPDTKNKTNTSPGISKSDNQGSRRMSANNNWNEADQAKQQEMDRQLSTSAGTQGADTGENPFPISDTESDSSSEEDAQQNEEDQENEDETEEDQNKFLDRALKEEQMREQMLEQQRGKKKQEIQKKRNLGMRILQQTQQQEMALKQDQEMAKKLSRAMQIKQKLDQKIRNLRLKKLPLQVTLRTLQITQLFIWVVRGLLQVLIFICTLLAWTIVLGIVGAILKGVDFFLTFMQRGISKLIDLIEKKIDSINEDIDKAKTNRKKAISVIQSIQRQKRAGPRLPTPKFDVPQAA